jgi:hypothetical protein
VGKRPTRELVIIGGILHQNLAQVRFAEDNHMVDALASDRSDQPFGEAVLARRAWGDGLVTDAHGPQSAGDECAVDLIPITDQVARRLSPRECFGDLACGCRKCIVSSCRAFPGLAAVASTRSVEATLDERVDVVALTHRGRIGMTRRVVD